MRRRRTKACHNPCPCVSTASVVKLVDHNELLTYCRYRCSRCWQRADGAFVAVTEFRKANQVTYQWTVDVCFGCLTEPERQLYQLQNMSCL